VPCLRDVPARRCAESGIATDGPDDDAAVADGAAASGASDAAVSNIYKAAYADGQRDKGSVVCGKGEESFLRPPAFVEF
jgi:hypothetical protein